MFIHLTRGSYGLSEYLITGKRKDSNLSRVEKDEVISLYGDLDAFAATEKYTNENKNWVDNYLHITCGFSKEDMQFLESAHNKDEILENIVRETISHYTQGYDLENEVIAYAEAHEPIIKTNEKGKERLSHIHIGISLLNPQTNNQLRVHSGDYWKNIDDYFKEFLSVKYGLEVPKTTPNSIKEFESSIGKKRKKLIDFFSDKSAEEVILLLKQDNWEYKIAHNSKHDYDYIKVKSIDKNGKENWINLRGKDFKHLEMRKEEVAKERKSDVPMNPDVENMDNARLDEIIKKDKLKALENFRNYYNDEIDKIRQKHKARENAKPCTMSYQNKVFYEVYKTNLNRDLKDYQINTNKSSQTHFYCKAQGVDVLDTGDKLTAKGTNTSEQIALMLDIAIAKGWDLSKIKITGGELFRQEAEKQINQRIREQLQAELAQEAQKAEAVELNKIKRPMSALDSAINQHIKNKPNIETIKKYYINGKGKAIIDKFIDSYEELKHLNKDNYQQLDNGKILNVATGKTKSIIDFFTKEAKIPLQTALAWLDKGIQVMEVETELEQNEKEKSTLQGKNNDLRSQIAESDKKIVDLDNQIKERDKQINKKIAELEAEIDKATALKSVLQDENKTLKSQKDERDKKIADIKNKIAERDNQIQAEKEREAQEKAKKASEIDRAQPQMPQNREVSHESSSAVNNNTQTPQAPQIVEKEPPSAAAEAETESPVIETEQESQIAKEEQEQEETLTEKMLKVDKAIADLTDTKAMSQKDNNAPQESPQITQEAQEAFWCETEAVLGKNQRIYDNIDYPHAFRSDLDLEKAVELAQEAEKANLPYTILEKSNPKKYRILIADSSENVADLAKKVKKANPNSFYHTKSLDELKNALKTQIKLKKITYRRR